MEKAEKKSLREEAIDVVWDLMKKIYNQEKMSGTCKGNVNVSVKKYVQKKCDNQNCGDMSNTTK